jgi:hypothetical protein
VSAPFRTADAEREQSTRRDTTMTPFGNRDFERTPSGGTEADQPADVTSWEHDAALSRLLERPVATDTTPGVTRDTRRVLVRMHGGDDIEVARVEGRETAVEIAREMVRTVDAAESAGEWPLVGDRLLRPGAILSIDVQRATAGQ